MDRSAGIGHSSDAHCHLSPAVARALSSRRAVVALESTVIAHGLQSPYNLETALGCEEEIRAAGAEPATIGIVAGRPVIGLENEQLDAIASRPDVRKVNLSNLANAVSRRNWGATTVASSLHLAHAVGIRVLSTGGIGGVHRGAGESFDVSADLLALRNYPLVVVCAGAKAILDLPKTFEALETFGIPVVGFRTEELPAFYSRYSGIRLELRAEEADEVAALAQAHWRLGFSTAVLVVQPVQVELEIPAEEIRLAVENALESAARLRIAGRDVTPYLLKRVAELTGGRALRANISLLRHNARLAGTIAKSLSEMEDASESERGSISV